MRVARNAHIDPVPVEGQAQKWLPCADAPYLVDSRGRSAAPAPFASVLSTPPQGGESVGPTRDTKGTLAKQLATLLVFVFTPLRKKTRTVCERLSTIFEIRIHSALLFVFTQRLAARHAPVSATASDGARFGISDLREFRDRLGACREREDDIYISLSFERRRVQSAAFP